MSEYGLILVLHMLLKDNIMKQFVFILMLYHSGLMQNIFGHIFIHVSCHYVIFILILERYDLINKISSQDIRLFMKDFDILELGQLPEP